MINHSPLWILILTCLLITACAQQGYEDLEAFINHAGKDLRGKVDPLPEIQPASHFIYQAFDVRDPFSSRKSKLDKPGNELQPDLKRPKEALESFPLENLSMVGSMQRGRHIFALVKAPDNTVHRVGAGNYLGQNFGLITQISETEITLREITQDSGNDWAERVGVLMLQTREQK